MHLLPVVEAPVQAEKPRCPSAKTLPPALPVGQGGPSPAERL